MLRTMSGESGFLRESLIVGAANEAERVTWKILDRRIIKKDG